MVVYVVGCLWAGGRIPRLLPPLPLPWPPTSLPLRCPADPPIHSWTQSRALTDPTDPTTHRLNTFLTSLPAIFNVPRRSSPSPPRPTCPPGSTSPTAPTTHLNHLNRANQPQVQHPHPLPARHLQRRLAALPAHVCLRRPGHERVRCDQAVRQPAGLPLRQLCFVHADPAEVGARRCNGRPGNLESWCFLAVWNAVRSAAVFFLFRFVYAVLGHERFWSDQAATPSHLGTATPSHLDRPCCTFAPLAAPLYPSIQGCRARACDRVGGPSPRSYRIMSFQIVSSYYVLSNTPPSPLLAGCSPATAGARLSKLRPAATRSVTSVTSAREPQSWPRCTSARSSSWCGRPPGG
jgi:hypothetical protein